MFHNVAGLWIQPCHSGWLTQNAMHFFFKTFHNIAGYWTQPGTQRLMVFILMVLTYLLFVESSLVVLVVNVKAAAECSLVLKADPLERRRKLVTQEVDLVVQEEIVPALLLFCVLE